MELLPPSSDIATKTDVDEIRSDISGLNRRMGGLEGRMDGLERRMDGLAGRMDRLDNRVAGLETWMERFDGRLHGFHVELRQQTRTFVLASTTWSAITATLAFTAAALI